VLEEEEAPQHGRPYCLALDLGETVAKITYNATGAPAPYDYHAGWRLCPKARAFVDAVGDARLADRVWDLLSEGGRRTATEQTHEASVGPSI
jgi:hypothetical protein